MNISVLGTGYVGLVTGACFAKLGHQVTCVDIDDHKVQMITSGKSPIYEEGLDDLLTTYKKNITATTDATAAIQNSEVTFICVGTPSRTDGSIDLGYVKDVTTQIAEVLKTKASYHVVVVKSTVLPGTTQTVVLPLLEKHSGKKAGNDFGVAMNPEFLKEGVAVQDFLSPDRIVIGSYDDHSKELMHHLYSSFTCPLVDTTLSAAEMIKYASNAFLATKISFINEIGNMCKTLGIDTYEVAEGMGLDKRIGRAFLDSGIGWGGSCFPKDIDALLPWAQHIKQPARIIASTKQVNEDQPLRLITLLKKHLPTLKGKTIGILGLAFKPNTDDIRESRAIPIVHQLLKEGAHIKAYDPQATANFKKMFPQLQYCTTAADVLTADAVLITTKWEEFTTLDYTGKIVIDGRRIPQAQQQARIYEGVCW
ncbi:MAG: UDP-glucose/GDP-mannose dehydrogenase family protein [Candidatus Thermoplasmatota archaeon]|nr:UDP-glucose/GDP-mannose dehydrogenase family protein [Candidatus Thermoplasmatota archaeon]